MSDIQAITDRVEIEALRGEFTDAVMQRDYDRFAALFAPDGAWRIPSADIELVGRDEIRAGIERLQAHWEYFVQTAHPGVVVLDGDAASGRTYLHELGRLGDGRSILSYALYHDRYRRTPEGWRFVERTSEVRYLDPTPLAGSGSSPDPVGAAGAPQPGVDR
jgi:ketosteroid isomerase-like protein